MKTLNSKSLACLLSLLLTVASFGAFSAQNQLGFTLDASGSVSATDYDLLRTGLNAAIAGLPLDGSVEITVVSYASGTLDVVAPTVLTASTLPTIQTAISTHTKTGGGTATHLGISRTATLMTGSSEFAPSKNTIINLATDGRPNSQSDAEAAAAAAFTAGIDALSIEAIGSGVSSPAALTNMAAIAFPDTVSILPVNSTSIPNPTSGSFVVPVSDFTALADVLNAKVQAAIRPTGVPEPHAYVLLAFGLMGLFFSKSARRAS